MRLVLVLIVIVAVGLVAGGFTGRTIAENAFNSSGGDSSDSNENLLPDDMPLVSGAPAPSEGATVSTTSASTSLAQQGLPQLLQAPTSSEAPTSNKAPANISELGSGSNEQSSGPGPSSGPISALQINSPQLYQVSRQVAASLTVEEGLIGDVNEDGSVDEVDLVQVAGSFDSIPGEPTLNGHVPSGGVRVRHPVDHV